ncbi:MAG: YifB family Mg chelatase-like AAA ATPase [Candidatus Eisenbacteria bacterium]|nr:YifB family Mg chelatase-like AAA ATPase [Candidatus Eisenbacteria bacterium]
MLSRIWSAALHGLEAYPVLVEADVGPGLAGFSTVGLPDMTVRESRERVISALRNSGLEFPLRRITVNLAPADLRKEGSAFDLPIALGILAASGQLPSNAADGFVVLGELSLDGSLRPLRGAIALAQAAGGAAHANGRGSTGDPLPCEAPMARALLLPRASAAEAALIPGAAVYGVDTLMEAVEVLAGTRTVGRACAAAAAAPGAIAAPDMAEVRGQFHARRALEVAAAGGHNLLFTGPPGAGKTLLARCLPGILPALSPAEALEVTRIRSVAGLLSSGTGLVSARPFRAPHHTVSGAGLVGGGRGPRPGEITLAHLGVLFLDELAEFPAHTLQLLRQPLEEGRVVISRVASSVEFPARFMLVGATNPCRCGNFGNPDKPCKCTPLDVERYRASISGPILDRIDMEVPVPSVPLREMLAREPGEASECVRTRVEGARKAQWARWRGCSARTNAEIRPEPLLARGQFDESAMELAARCAEKLKLSARGYHRLLRTARTVADLAACEEVRAEHVAEAAGFRATLTVRL